MYGTDFITLYNVCGVPFKNNCDDKNFENFLSEERILQLQMRIHVAVVAWELQYSLLTHR